MKVIAMIAILTALLASVAGAQQSELLEPLNTGVNALLEAAGAPNRLANRVVPIVTSGGANVGMAQIVGPQSSIDATRAVLEVRSAFGSAWNVQALIPVTSVGRNGAIHRQYGVGVDAVIGMHI
jgi:hypothetical protein